MSVQRVCNVRSMEHTTCTQAVRDRANGCDLERSSAVSVPYRLLFLLRVDSAWRMEWRSRRDAPGPRRRATMHVLPYATRFRSQPRRARPGLSLVPDTPRCGPGAAHRLKHIPFSTMPPKVSARLVHMLHIPSESNPCHPSANE